MRPVGGEGRRGRETEMKERVSKGESEEGNKVAAMVVKGVAGESIHSRRLLGSSCAMVKG